MAINTRFSVDKHLLRDFRRNAVPFEPAYLELKGLTKQIPAIKIFAPGRRDLADLPRIVRFEGELTTRTDIRSISHPTQPIELVQIEIHITAPVVTSMKFVFDRRDPKYKTWVYEMAQSDGYLAVAVNDNIDEILVFNFSVADLRGVLCRLSLLEAVR